MMHDHEVLPQVHHIFNLVRTELGPTFGRDRLFWLVARSRGRPLMYEQRPLRAGYHGCCFGLLDVDVICVRSNLAPERARFVDLHEASHFFLQHVPRHSFGEDTPSYAAYCQHADAGIFARALHRSVYDRPTERAAELLGRLFAPMVRHYDRVRDGHVATLPPSLVDLYGDEQGDP